MTGDVPAAGSEQHTETIYLSIFNQKHKSMKKFAILLLMSCFALTAAAQDETAEAENVKNVRKKFFNISYLSDKIKVGDFSFSFNEISDEIQDIADSKNIGLKNNWGISLTRGRSYMLHKKPIARLISIGIDASFFDVSYANYTCDDDFKKVLLGNSDDDKEIGDFHKMEYSFQVGPSITITPGKKLTVAAYFRYAPTFSCLYVDETFAGNYASMFVTGASVAYGKIGVGIEARMGSCKYKTFSGDHDFSDSKIKTSGFRAFIQFRW